MHLHGLITPILSIIPFPPTSASDTTASNDPVSPTRLRWAVARRDAGDERSRQAMDLKSGSPEAPAGGLLV